MDARLKEALRVVDDELHALGVERISMTTYCNPYGRRYEKAVVRKHYDNPSGILGELVKELGFARRAERRIEPCKDHCLFEAGYVFKEDSGV